MPTFNGSVRTRRTVNVERGTGTDILDVGFDLLDEGYKRGEKVKVVIEGKKVKSIRQR